MADTVLDIDVGLNTSKIKQAIKEILEGVNEGVEEGMEDALVNAEKDLQKSTEKLNKTITTGLNGFKKMLGLILGAGTAFALMKQIVTQVIRENDALNNTIQGIKNALVALSADALEGVIRGFANVLNYALNILSVITGINLIAKATAKTTKKSGASSSKLASFDKSEVIKKNGGGAGGSNETFLKQIELNETLLGIANQIKEIWEKIKNILKTIGDAINTYIIQPLGSFLVNSILPRILAIISSILDVLQALIDAVSPALKWLYDNIIVPIATWIGDKLVEALDWINEKIQALAQWIRDNEKLLQTILLIVISFVAGVLLVNGVLSVLGGLIGGLIGIIGAVITVWNILNSSMFAVYLVIGIIIAIVALLITHWEEIKEVALEVWDAIKEATQQFMDAIVEAFDQFKEIVSQVWKDLWNGAISMFETFVNGIIRGINRMVEALNKIHFDIPDWVPLLGGKSFGINLSTVPEINLPRLAKGAVIQPNKPFMAMLGDQRFGNNIEAPEGLIRQIMREEQQNLSINISADSTASEFVRWLKFELEKENSRRGASLLRSV